MNFVDDIDFIAVAGGHVFDVFAQCPDIINAIIGRAIDFMHIDGIAVCNFKAGRTEAAGLGRGAFVTVETFGKNARDGGLTDAPLSAKKKGMGDTLLFDGVAQRAGYMLLADNLVEGLRSALACYDSVGHKIRRLA